MTLFFPEASRSVPQLYQHTGSIRSCSFSCNNWSWYNPNQQQNGFLTYTVYKILQTGLKVPLWFTSWSIYYVMSTAQFTVMCVSLCLCYIGIRSIRTCWMAVPQLGYEKKKKKRGRDSRQGWETTVKITNNNTRVEQPQASTGGVSRQAQASPWRTKSSSDENCFHWHSLVSTGCSSLSLERPGRTFTSAFLIWVCDPEGDTKPQPLRASDSLLLRSQFSTCMSRWDESAVVDYLAFKALVHPGTGERNVFTTLQIETGFTEIEKLDLTFDSAKHH